MATEDGRRNGRIVFRNFVFNDDQRGTFARGEALIGGGGGEGGGGGVTYKSSASRVACNYVCTSLREARGGFAVGCASFLSAATTTSSCACVCIIHPPVLFIFFPFSFSFLHPTRPRFTVRFGHRSLGDGNILLGSPFAVEEWKHFWEIQRVWGLCGDFGQVLKGFFLEGVKLIWIIRG